MKIKTLYHGTSSINLTCIKTIGLVPGHSKGGDAWAEDHHMTLALFSKRRVPSVFVSDEIENAQEFARYAVEEVGGEPIVVTLRVPEPVFETYVVDELFEQDNSHPHAWRVHSVDVAYVAEVKHVAPPTSEEKLVSMLASLLMGR